MLRTLSTFQRLIVFTLCICAVSTAAQAQTSKRTGTAFSVTKDGLLVTSAHLLKDMKSVRVFSAKSGQSFEAKLVASDDLNDLALLKTDLATQPIVVADFAGVPNGLEIFALGFPLPSFQGRELKVTSGIINARSGLRGAPGSFQFSAPIQSGNSGGPVIAADGSVVGVVHGKLIAKTTGGRQSSEAPQNVSFATDSNALADFLASQGTHIIRQTIKLSKILRPHEIFEMVQPSVFFVEVTFETAAIGLENIPLALRRILEGYTKEDQSYLLGAYFGGFKEILRSKKEVLLLRTAMNESPKEEIPLQFRYTGPVKGVQFQMIVSFDEPKKYNDKFSYQSVFLEMAYDCANDASATLFREYKTSAFAGGPTRLKLVRKSEDAWDPTKMKAIKSPALKDFLRKKLCKK